jgi:alpha,alpha-trehalose phosphorylase
MGAYEIDEWALVKTSLDPEGIGSEESLFTVASGGLGLRGDHEEGDPSFHRGTYLNGFFEQETINYGEIAYGYAENHQTMLNVPDAKLFRLELDGHPFSLKLARIDRYERRLDFRSGELVRMVTFTLASGAVAELETRRLASFARPLVASFRWSLRLTEGCAEVSVFTGIDGGPRNLTAADDPRVGAKFSERPLIPTRLEVAEDGGLVEARTRRSGLAMACAARIRAWRTGVARTEGERGTTMKLGDSFFCVRRASLSAGEELVLEKAVAYRWGLAGDEGRDLAVEAVAAADSASEAGYSALTAEQRRELDSFWRDADLFVDGSAEIRQALRFNLFHVFQAAGRDGRTSLCAKGLTGEGYQGHYFWDTEIYACPIFTYTRPDLARSLLAYRHSILDAARERARVMSQRGALFPWRTIDGRETSAYYPAGTAQYHIDADIAYAVQKYLAASGDGAFAEKEAAEIAVETARLWAGLGRYGEDGLFRIHCVTGPDEYSALVDDNAYTNLMARNNLRWAACLVDSLPQAARESLGSAVGLRDEEIEGWRRAAGAMAVPFDPVTGIHPQDDGFMNRPDWDFAGTPREKYPLLLHFHPLVIYRHRVLKQPDLVLAEFLLSAEFSRAQKIRDFRFYEPRTTGDSSLSHCIQSVMAAEIGDHGKAYDYFLKTVRMDLDDVHGNARDGLHLAAMAGSWISAVYGFAGFRDYDGRFSFDPRLPDDWKGLSFRLAVGGGRLGVELSRDEVRYSFEVDRKETRGSLTLFHRDTEFSLAPGKHRVFSLKRQLRAVLFDLDGVITDTARLHYLAWKAEVDALGLKFDEKLNERLKGVSREASLGIILEANGLEMTASERIAIARRKNERYVASLDVLTERDVLSGVRELLAGLRVHGVSAVLTSASKNAPRILERLGLSKEFELVVDPSSIVKGKPDPELFLRGAELAGAYRLDCVGIEDAQAGIDAIRAAGMAAVGVCGEGGPELIGAHRSVKSLNELTVEHLERLLESIR